MICILNMLFNHPVSEATPNSEITGAYYTVISNVILNIVVQYLPWFVGPYKGHGSINKLHLLEFFCIFQNVFKWLNKMSKL
jgi:hypothetical protein